MIVEPCSRVSGCTAFIVCGYPIFRRSVDPDRRRGRVVATTAARRAAPGSPKHFYNVKY